MRWSLTKCPVFDRLGCREAGIMHGDHSRSLYAGQLHAIRVGRVQIIVEMEKVARHDGQNALDASRFHGSTWVNDLPCQERSVGQPERQLRKKEVPLRRRCWRFPGAC